MEGGLAAMGVKIISVMGDGAGVILRWSNPILCWSSPISARPASSPPAPLDTRQFYYYVI